MVQRSLGKDFNGISTVSGDPLSSRPTNGSHGTGNRNLSALPLVVVIGVCCLVSAAINIMHTQQLSYSTAIYSHLQDFASGHLLDGNGNHTNEMDENNDDGEEELEDDKINDDDKPKRIAEKEKWENESIELEISRGKNDVNVRMGHLSCTSHGGPADEFAKEMVYWRDIESDRHYVSPFHVKKGERRRYMTFEPDGGGWNNIRMAMETVLGLAIATGRTLVMPPEQRMYLLAKGRGTEKTDFSFADFFPMHELAQENDGLEIITMKEFLETEAMAGNLMNKVTGKVEFPPENRTDWNGHDVSRLKEWLRNVTLTPLWSPSNCMAAFPTSGDHRDVELLRQMLQQVLRDGTNRDNFVENPIPVDSPPSDRMSENIAGRRELCIYDEEMQNALVVHFMCYHKMRVRMLVHFYAFLFFESWQEDLWMKRFMRDHVRYIDEIQCAAARIVHAMREYDKSRKKDDPRSDSVGMGEFDTFHIRRGDFQFKRTRIEANEIYENTKELLTPGATIFIATDERDKSFFNPLKAHYDVKFLDDFHDLLEGVNVNYYGMIDQLVASRGRKFFGCWHSTFTGFINRMRGYHSVNDQAPGYENGALPTSYYYVPIDNRNAMHKYAKLHGPFFNREFPTSWRDIDKSVGDLQNAMKQ